MENFDFLPQDLCSLIAKHLLQLRIDQNNLAFTIHDRDRIGCRFQQPAEFLLGLLAILNVGRDPVPLENLASSVPQRHSAHLEATILPIGSTEPCLVHQRLAGGHRCPPFFVNPLHVIRMHYSLPTRACRLPNAQPRILLPALVDERVRAIGQSCEGHGRNCLDGFPKFSFLLLQLPNAKSKQPPNEPEGNCRTQRAEPVRLVVSRQNREIQNRTFLVPHAAVVGSRDAEAVVARAEVRILHPAVVHYLSPVLVLALQLEAEGYLFW